MKISVQKIYSKGSRKISEDELLIKDNLFAVFDGATRMLKPLLYLIKSPAINLNMRDGLV